MTSPEVSIILPTYNRLQFLRAAVDSVFAQTFGDWELIIADDGSTGETAAYLASLAENMNVRVVYLRHCGNPAAVRNAACRAARGELIAFLDSDDLWLPQKLAVQCASLQAHPQRGWSHTAFAVMDRSGALLSGASALSWPAAEGWILEHLIEMDLIIAMPSVMVRRRLLEQVGGFDCQLRMCEDYDLYLRLAGLSELDGVRETLVHVRRHGEHFHQPTEALAGRVHALANLLAAEPHPRVRTRLQRARAQAAAALACGQAIRGGRRAALQILWQSAAYSWRYGLWWRGAGEAAARALAPASARRIARLLLGRGRIV